VGDFGGAQTTQELLIWNDHYSGKAQAAQITGALLDRLTHQVHILTMNGDSYRLNQSKKRQRKPSANPVTE
jgi:DNA replication protein DnaC